MIPYHLHIHLQFIYELFHIHYVISLLSRENKYSQLTSLPMCGFIAQLVEHRSGIAEVTGSNYTIRHFTPLTGKEVRRIDLAPNVWLHSSVGRTSHRYREGQGFESR